MITGLAVRFERASLFLLNARENFVRNRFSDCKLFNAGVGELRIANRELWFFRGGLQLIQSMIQLFNARIQQCQIRRLYFGFDQFRDLVR